MRWLVLVLVVVLPAVAWAKPKVAVAPLDNDPDGKVTAVLVDAADDHASVTRPAKVEKAMDKLSLSELDKRALKKLRIELEVEVVIHGKVSREKGKRHVELVLSGKGKKQMTIDVAIGSPKTLKKDLSKRLDKKIEEMTGGDEDPDDDAPPARKFNDASEDKPNKHADDDRPRKHADDDRPKKHVAADDEVTDSDEDTGRRHHRHRHHGEASRNPMTTGAVWLDVGAEVARRTLTWESTGTMRPPRVGTAAGAARIGGEVYPFAFDSPTGGQAGLGLYGDYARTIGLSIAVPGTALKTPIEDGHYQIGARYRFVFGDTSIAVGGAYWRRYYIANRSSLMMATQLDMPDVDYKAFAPGAELRFAATPTVSGFVSFDVPLVMKSGDIQSATSYGRGTVIAFDVLGGVQILLGPHYALQLAGAFDQVGMKFEAAANSQAQIRSVSAATDRSYGVNATIGILY
ncbi:MAG: hypothetical protein ABI467_26095 [Kofleriaceae bacterium]